jgi:hypothetical protein
LVLDISNVFNTFFFLSSMSFTIHYFTVFALVFVVRMCVYHAVYADLPWQHRIFLPWRQRALKQPGSARSPCVLLFASKKLCNHIICHFILCNSLFWRTKTFFFKE